MNDKQHKQLLKTIDNAAFVIVLAILAGAGVGSCTIMMVGSDIVTQARNIDWTIHHGRWQ